MTQSLMLGMCIFCYRAWAHALLTSVQLGVGIQGAAGLYRKSARVLAPKVSAKRGCMPETDELLDATTALIPPLLTAVDALERLVGICIHQCCHSWLTPFDRSMGGW